MEALGKVTYASAYPARAVLFVEGQTSRGVYVLCRGRLKLTMNSAEGKTLIVRIRESGEILGLHATLSGQPYELTAEALQPCQIDFIRRDDFLRLMREQPVVSAAVVRQLSERYRQACQEIRHLGLCRTATEKVAQFLLESSTHAQETSQGKRFHLGLTHEEISQMIGISRETVTRTLSEFRHKRLIATNGAIVLIQNEPQLRALAVA
jgi:CRP/FNR family transcriptional regulator